MSGNFRTHDEDGALDGMTLDEFLIENKEATFIMRAKSDSMKDEGILRGDLLLIDRAREPKCGDIVIVVTDGVFAMRRMSAEPRAGKESVLKVEAVVAAVIRKY